MIKTVELNLVHYTNSPSELQLHN